MNIRRVIFTGLLLGGSLTLANAQWDAEDIASNPPYDDNSAEIEGTDNGGTGWNAWQPVVSSGFFSAISGTGGGASTALHTSGETFVMYAGASGFIAGARDTTGFTPTTGTVYQFRLQSVASSTNFESRARLTTGGTNFFESLRVAAFDEEANWIIEDGELLEADTGIPNSTPILVTVTYQGVGGLTYDIEVEDLNGVETTFTATGRDLINTGAPDGIYFTAINNNASDDAVLFFNNIYMDTTGALPVELDSFVVE